MRIDYFVKRIASLLGLPEKMVSDTYRAYWRFIKDTIEQLPLKEELTEEQFNELRTNFNIPSLGKLSCTYKRYKGIKKMFHKFIAGNGKDTQIEKGEAPV